MLYLYRMMMYTVHSDVTHIVLTNLMKMWRKFYETGVFKKK